MTHENIPQSNRIRQGIAVLVATAALYGCARGERPSFSNDSTADANPTELNVVSESDIICEEVSFGAGSVDCELGSIAIETDGPSDTVTATSWSEQEKQKYESFFGDPGRSEQLQTFIQNEAQRLFELVQDSDNFAMDVTTSDVHSGVRVTISGEVEGTEYRFGISGEVASEATLTAPNGVEFKVDAVSASYIPSNAPIDFYDARDTSNLIIKKRGTDGQYETYTRRVIVVGENTLFETSHVNGIGSHEGAISYDGQRGTEAGPNPDPARAGQLDSRAMGVFSEMIDAVENNRVIQFSEIAGTDARELIDDAKSIEIALQGETNHTPETPSIYEEILPQGS